MKTPMVILLFTLCLLACTPENNVVRIVGQSESDRVELTAEFSEPITRREVVEGEAVKAGQRVLEQDTSRILAKLDELEAELAQHQARLDELIRGPRQERIVASRADVEGARKELAFQETELERVQAILDQNLASPEARDRVRTNRDTARARLNILQAQLEELLAGTTVEELRQAEAQLQNTRARLHSLQIDLERHTVMAPSESVVDTLLYQVGERPKVGDPVAVLLAGPQAYARVYVPESLRISVSPGTKAEIHVDGLAEPLEGRVRWVSNEATFTPYFALTQYDRGRLSYVAKVDILNYDKRVPDGIPLEVVLPDSGL